MKISLACALFTLAGLAGTIQMPPTCTKPDGMAVDPQGRLVIAAPNNNRRQPGAVFRLDKPDGVPYKWFDVPPAPSGFAQPMGLCFGPEGELYVCDCQDKGQGRLLRITFKDDRLATCETVAENLDNANGVKYLNGRLYVTQAFLYGVKRGDGAATSGLYMFAATDRHVRPGNTPADAQCVFSDVTRNPQVRCGLNGVAVTGPDTLWVGNYGDGHVWKLTVGADGRIAAAKPLVPATAGIVTPDGLCADAAGNVYVADMRGCQAVRISPTGEVKVLKKGGFTLPSEPCAWQGSLYLSNYGATTVEGFKLP